MPLIILGLLVVGGLLAYMYVSGRSETSAGEHPKETGDSQQEESASVIYLPTDIEREKKRRKVKTGK